MSELISIGILIGLAAFGFGCHFAGKSRAKTVAAPTRSALPRAKISVSLVFLVFALAIPSWFGKAQTVPDPLKIGSQKDTVVRQSLNALRSLRFEPTADGASMVSRSERRSLRVTPGGSVEIHSQVLGQPAEVELRLDGSNPTSAVTGSKAIPSHSNYFLGSDQAKWRSGVAQFEQARVKSVYPGIDLLYYGNGESLEHDYQLAAGADPALIRMTIRNSVPLIDNTSGDLVVSQPSPSTELLRLHKPVAYQANPNGSRGLVAVAYRQNNDGSFSFALGDYDRSRPLVIDPVITYSTYFGGNYDDGVNDVKLDAAGNIYLLLQTSSIDMPVISQIAGACNGMCGPNNPGTASYYTSYDYFVAKLDPTGQKLLFSTYIGGSEDDDPGTLVLGTDGKIYLSGQTFSADFPVVNEHSRSLAPLGEFNEQTTTSTLTVLSADGSKILYSTFIGGGFALERSNGTYVDYGYDGGNGLANAPSSLAVAPDGVVYLLGYATTITPGSGAARPFYDAKGAEFLPGDGSFIAKFDTTKVGDDSLIYARPFGSPGDEQGWQFSGIALDSKQNLWVFGQVGLSAPLPTPDAVQPVCGAGGGSQCGNAFLFKMNPVGAITYSTYLGGTTTPNGGVPIEHPEMIYIDPADNVYLSGLTESSDFPTVNAAYTAATIFSTGGGFLTKLSPGGQSILYSTYLPERNSLIAATPEGMAAAVVAEGINKPVVNGLPQNPDLGFQVQDAYILLFDTTKAGASSVVSLGYLGSSGALPGAVTFDAQQNLVLAGSVYGALPVVDPYQNTCSGTCQGTAKDGFLTRIQYQAGKLTLTPATESFANTNVGSTSAPFTATLTNSTAQTIILSVPSLTDSTDFTATDNCNGSLASTASCTITFTFKPSAAGTLSSTYSIADASQPDSPLTIQLSGVGVAVVPPATLAPTALNFGNVTVGSTSGVMIANLTNTSTASYQVSSITQSSSAIIVHTSYCARAVAPGAYCKLEITVAPTATGAFIGSVVINYYLGDGSTPSQNFTSTLQINATGIAPAVTLTPASADFGSIAGGQTSPAQTFTVTNNYTTAVALAQLTIAGPFTIAAGATCISGAQLAAGQSCAIPVVFIPTETGPATGTLYFSYIGSSGGPISKTSSLTGTGTGSFANATLTPISYDFGNVTVGTMSNQFRYQFTNTGSVPLHLSTESLSIPGFFFPITPATTCQSAVGSAPLPPGASCYLAITFKPLKAGILIATLRVPSEAGTKTATVSGTGVTPTATFTPATHNFGNVNNGSVSNQFLFTLTNTSNIPLHTAGPASSSKLFVFPVTTATTCTDIATIAPGTSCTLAVEFSPTATGTATGTTSIQSEAGTKTATVTGTGVPLTATITPATYNFGDVIVGSTSSQVLLKFTNTSLVPIHAGNATGTLPGLLFPISSATTCTGNLGGAALTLQPGASCNLVVAFAPKTVGTQTGVVNIPSEIQMTTALLTGTGVAPAPPPTLAPAMLSFGNVTVGATSAAQIVTFKNPATFPLTLESIGLTGSGFSIQAAGTTCKTGPAIAAGGSCTLSIIFSPATAGAISGSLTVSLPAGLSASSLSIPLTGTGVAVVVSPETINFTNGFTSNGVTLNGAATVSGGVLQLTASQPSQASSAFYPTQVSAANFSTDFAFQLLDPLAEGITFTIQGDSPTAIGSNVGGLGYQGIAKSIALKFDLRDTGGEGDDSTGIYVDGAPPTLPSTSLAASGIDLHSGDVFTVHLSYDGTTESITLMDSVTGAMWTTKVAEDIPGIVGSSQAYFGFTASTGATAASSAAIRPSAAAASASVGSTANILYWAYSSQSDGVAALQPIQLNFGNVTVGSTSGVQSALLTNTGTASYQVSSITQSDPAIIVHTSYCARPVTPGNYCKVEVTVAPTAAGAFTGTVVINYFLGDGSTPSQNYTNTLTISANGVTSGVTLTPASVDFGRVASGNTSSPHTFTVTNNYATAISLTRIETADSFGSAAYQVGTGATCISGGQLPAGKSCTIPLTFTPTTNGADAGTLYESYLDPSGQAVTQTSHLTGTGVAPPAPTVKLTPTSYNFGNVTLGATKQYGFTLTNTGSVPLIITTITNDNVQNFQAGQSCQLAQLAPGATCTVQVVFAPQTAGLQTSGLIVSVSDINLNNVVFQTASITGTGVAPSGAQPEVINFANGFTADALTSTGPATVTNGVLQLTSGPSAAASSAFFPTPVSTTNFTTDVTFQLLDPTAEGITFTIQGDGPNAIGTGGGGLGYQGIPKSLAIKFDLKDTAGEGTDSTGVYIDGAAPTVPAISLASSGIDLHSGHVFGLTLTYDGTTMTINLIDTITHAVWATQVAEDIPSIVGSNLAYFGFTAGSGTPALTSDVAESQRMIDKAAINTAVSAQPSATSSILAWTYIAGKNTGTAQTINFPSLSGIKYGAAPRELTATATSGLPVRYAVTGPARLSGSTLTITGAGDITVTATQSGNAIFAPAAPVEIIVNIVKASLTVTANNLMRSYNTANPALTYTITGFVDGDTPSVISGTANLLTTAIAASPAGTYPITFATKALATANYEFTYVSGTLTVLPAGASCAVIDYSKGLTATGLSLNGSAKIVGGLLQLTDGGRSEAGSAFFSTPVPTTSFSTDVTFQLVNPEADGITFVIQAVGPHALGEGGGGLGYAGIGRSVALKFDLHNNAGEGTNSTGVYINGAYPGQPSIPLDGLNLDLHSGHIFRLHIVYDGKAAVASLTDTVTGVVLHDLFPGNIMEGLGTSSAYYGFTAGTGEETATQEILAWTYSGGSGCPVNP